MRTGGGIPGGDPATAAGVAAREVDAATVRSTTQRRRFLDFCGDARLSNPRGITICRYVSSGDHVRTHYTLDMAVLALRLPGGPSHPRPPPPPPPRKRQQPQRRTIPAECEKKRGGDSIYGFLAGALTDDGLDASWGEVLDAGAGLSSMCWLAHRESRLYARHFAGVADPLTELCAAGVFREL